MGRHGERPTAVWGSSAVSAAFTALRPVDQPSTSRSPLAHAVARLAESALGTSEDMAGDDRAEALDIDRGWFADASLLVVDAVLARDKPVLDEMDSLLRRIHRLLVIASQPSKKDHRLRCESWLQVTMEFVRSAQERIAPVAVAANVAGTHAERFLRIVAGHPGINSRQIGQLIAAGRTIPGREPDMTPGREAAVRVLDEGQLSRIGRKLRTQGLVFAARGPHGLAWELTPRGRLVIDRFLSSQENADRPIDSMVIATPEAGADEIAATLSAAEPTELKVVRSGEVIRYQRCDTGTEHVEATPAPSPSNADDLSTDAASMTLRAAMSDLLENREPQPPVVFSLDNGVVYQQVEYSSV